MSSTSSSQISTFTPAVLTSYRNYNIKTSELPTGMLFIAFGCGLAVVIVAFFANWFISIIISWYHARQETYYLESAKYRKAIGLDLNNETAFDRTVRDISEKVIRAKRKCERATVKPVRRLLSIAVPGRGIEEPEEDSSMYVSPTNLLQKIYDQQPPPRSRSKRIVRSLSRRISRGVGFKERRNNVTTLAPPRVTRNSFYSSRNKINTARINNYQFPTRPRQAPTLFLDSLLSKDATHA
ncbi:HCL008Cp [Eremothecium sinecaudum]|uniref:HCL008Cp n=1 Tax=Eremothecium sinecaudum TaxID=45286 RepID=A0A109UYN7_9SACH|nr:HCL008Cp [Eremothecium sinecaudum]AMD20143.1 HCL008Cp [Eremothecium sinecaudum]